MARKKASKKEWVFLVSDLLRPETKVNELSYGLDLAVGDLDPELVPKGRFQASLTLQRRGDSIGALLTEGRLPVELQCLRCLVNFTYILVLTSTERYFYPPGRMPPEEKGEQFYLAEGNRIDIGELLRQEIMLALPIRPVCSQKCPGICAHCGQRRRQCHCSPQPAADSCSSHQPLANLSRLWRKRGKGKA